VHYLYVRTLAGGFIMKDDSAVEYWIPFVKRMKNIPVEYQLAIIDEYEKDMNVERMWDLLLAGENEVKLVAGKHRQAN